MDPNFIDLFERARQGDQNALGQLLVALSDRLHRYAYRLLGHREDAEDAAHDAALGLIRCIRSRRTFEFPDAGSFEALVFTIVARAAWRILNRRRPLLDPTEYRLVELLDPHSEDDSVDRADDIRCVLEAADELEADDRFLFDLRYIQTLSSTVIEGLTHTNQNTIRTRLVRLRQRLRAILERRSPQLAARLFGADAAG